MPKPGQRGLQDNGDFVFSFEKIIYIYIYILGEYIHIYGERYINGPHKQYIQVDITVNYIVHFGLPGKCL